MSNFFIFHINTLLCLIVLLFREMIYLKKLFKTDSVESIAEYIQNVENSNSEKISDMIRNTVDIFFEIHSILQTFSDDPKLSENVNDVENIISQIKDQLSKFEKQNQKHQKLLNTMCNDTKLLKKILFENKELINMNNNETRILRQKAENVKKLCESIIRNIEKHDKIDMWFNHYELKDVFELESELDEVIFITQLLLENDKKEILIEELQEEKGSA